MNNEYKQKVQDYQKNQATMTDAIRVKKLNYRISKTYARLPGTAQSKKLKQKERIRSNHFLIKLKPQYKL
jgi:hypothetical protein